MLSGVLRSKQAVAVNIAIMRALFELRRAATSYTAIENRLEELERETAAKLGQHDQHLVQSFDALRELMAPPSRPKRRVGFTAPEHDEEAASDDRTRCVHSAQDHGRPSDASATGMRRHQSRALPARTRGDFSLSPSSRSRLGGHTIMGREEMAAPRPTYAPASPRARLPWAERLLLRLRRRARRAPPAAARRQRSQHSGR